MSRVGIVLGAGGITGIAWLLGALEAVREHTGWEPATADVLSGTSAGAVAAVVTAARVDPEELLAMAEHPATLDAAIRAAGVLPRRSHEPSREHTGRLARLTGPLGRGAGAVAGSTLPGSLALGLTGLAATDPRHRLSSLAGFLPRGPRAADEIRGLTHAAAQRGWPERTQLLLHACDYRTGRRVTFGAEGAPPASLADAVTASAAVPAYYRPVRIGGRDYVDGGLVSFTNADALAGLGCDVVLCLSPFSSRVRGPAADVALYGAPRRATAWRLRQEAATLRAEGTRVALVEPAAVDLRAMPLNVMDRSCSRRVLETARASVAARLPELLDGIVLPAPPARCLATAA